jgi:hypothetical protein
LRSIRQQPVDRADQVLRMHRLGEDARLALAADLVLQRHGGKPVMSITLTSDRRSLAMRVQLGPPHAGHHRICRRCDLGKLRILSFSSPLLYRCLDKPDSWPMAIEAP